MSEINRRKIEESRNDISMDISIDEMQPNEIENVIINETNQHSENGSTSSISEINRRELEILEDFRNDEHDHLLVNYGMRFTF
ncbi:uncharacterized protein LOC143899364 isoform X2 [Temnothorax americanus]|uniref:uncharacterized protein LOC143899364 isoform X2 n=1 Tax=Temnothorax americanus TaxID=1964332 RepID=UPI00406976D7